MAVVLEAHGPQLVAADLACPVCGAEFLLRGGIARFGAPVPSIAAHHPDAERLAALLGMTGGTVPVLLTGAYARAGAALAALVDVPQVWLDAPDDADTDVPMLSRLVGTTRLPLGVETLAAAAVDRAHAEAPMVSSITRALRVGGRLVAPTSVERPADLKELARDAHEWVAESTTRASGLIELRRRVES